MTQATASPTTATSRSQFLTFKLRDEDYGVEILKVQEIKGCSKITPIPNSPSYVHGVMNLRGTVVPVIDLRARFGLPATDFTQFTVIIVVNVGTRVVGLIVDAVSEVLDIPDSDIDEAPDLGASMNANFLSGMGKAGDRLVMLLDIDRLLGDESLATSS